MKNYFLLSLVAFTFSNSLLPAAAAADQDKSKILEMSRAFMVSRALHVVTELGVADQLQDGAKTAAELAQALSVHELSLNGCSK